MLYNESNRGYSTTEVLASEAEAVILQPIDSKHEKDTSTFAVECPNLAGTKYSNAHGVLIIHVC